MTRTLRRRLIGPGLVMFAAVLAWGAGAGAADFSGAPASALDSDSSFGADSLPRPLSDADAEHYARVFALQRDGRWKAADAEIAKIADPVLMGHVKAQRLLHPTDYRSSFAELRDWLTLYVDLPEAPVIYRLAMSRKPAKEKAPQRPDTAYLSGGGSDFGVYGKRPPREELNLSEADQAKARRIKSKIRARVRSGWPTGAKEILDAPESRHLLDSVDYDELMALIASGYFAYAKDETALDLAEATARHAKGKVPEADWIAGIAAWRMGDPELATRHFEAVAKSKYASRWDVAAAGFWAARANLVTRNPAEVSRWLAIAAKEPRSFYGILARRALGMDLAFDWSAPAFDAAAMRRAESDPAVERAFALLQIGQHNRAESELRKAYMRADPALANAIYGMALAGDFPSLAMRIGLKIHRETGRMPDAAFYPVPNWTPAEGYQINRSLLFAVIRQESRFDTRAKSGAGARGLMQIMPGTARFLADGEDGDDDLYDPEANIAMGQQYISHLMDDGAVQGNLLMLVAAYNGGPGKLAEWKRKIDDNNDPLLFLESIPSPETRNFVERVLANMWVYQQRLGQPSPSMDALVSGDWPDYAPVDGSDLKVAGYERD